MLTALFWFFVVPSTLAALFSIRKGKAYLEYVEDSLAEPRADYAPPATLFLPVKGLDHDLAGNLRSLIEQDYPDYELIVVCRDAADEALRVVGNLGPGVRVLVAGDPPGDTGEKVHNLLFAVAQARAESEVFVFADSDGRVAPGWMRSLVAPLADGGLGAVTGFRWYFPEAGGFWPLLRSVWDSTIAGNMNVGDKNFAWGGATAIRKATFEKSRVTEFWNGSVSDDYRLSNAVNQAGLGVRFAPGAMAAAEGTCSAREFLNWAVRQLIITRVYRRGLWWAGLVSHVFYCGAMAASLLLAAAGDPLGWGGLVVASAPGMARGASRAAAARMMFPDRQDWFDRFDWAYFWMTPLATWTWLYVFLASALTRRIAWRGNVYQLISPRQTRCVSARKPDR